MLTSNDKRTIVPSLAEILDEINREIEASSEELENMKNRPMQSTGDPVKDAAHRHNRAAAQVVLENRIRDLQQKRLQIYYNERTNET